MKITIGQIVTTFLTVVVLGAGWFFLAPPQLGGSSSYVQVYGTSMEPRLHGGDLVVVRGGGPYRVGDVVAYRNGALGGHVVLHRIIRVAGDRYVFKGDHNDFVDSYHPAQSELVGRMWVHVPAAGRYLVWLHGRNLLLVGGLGLLAILALSLELGGVRRRVRRPAATPAGPAAHGQHGSFGALPALGAALLLAGAGLAALGYTRPLSTTGTQHGPLHPDRPLRLRGRGPGGRPRLREHDGLHRPAALPAARRRRDLPLLLWVCIRGRSQRHGHRRARREGDRRERLDADAPPRRRPTLQRRPRDRERRPELPLARTPPPAGGRTHERERRHLHADAAAEGEAARGRRRHGAGRRLRAEARVPARPEPASAPAGQRGGCGRGLTAHADELRLGHGRRSEPALAADAPPAGGARPGALARRRRDRARRPARGPAARPARPPDRRARAGRSGSTAT